MTGKIVALTDAPGNPVGFALLPGQRHDTVGVSALIKGRRFGGLVADPAFAVNWIVDDLDGRQAGMVIAQRANRVVPRAIDRHIDQWRHLIENYFGKLKEFNASPCAPAKPTPASPLRSMPAPPASTPDKSQRALVPIRAAAHGRGR